MFCLECINASLVWWGFCFFCFVGCVVALSSEANGSLSWRNFLGDDYRGIPSLKPTYPLKIDLWKRRFLLETIRACGPNNIVSAQNMLHFPSWWCRFRYVCCNKNLGKLSLKLPLDNLGSHVSRPQTCFSFPQNMVIVENCFLLAKII